MPVCMCSACNVEPLKYSCQPNCYPFATCENLSFVMFQSKPASFFFSKGHRFSRATPYKNQSRCSCGSLQESMRLADWGHMFLIYWPAKEMQHHSTRIMLYFFCSLAYQGGRFKLMTGYVKMHWTQWVRAWYAGAKMRKQIGAKTRNQRINWNQPCKYTVS